MARAEDDMLLTYEEDATMPPTVEGVLRREAELYELRAGATLVAVPAPALTPMQRYDQQVEALARIRTAVEASGDLHLTRDHHTSMTASSDGDRNECMGIDVGQLDEFVPWASVRTLELDLRDVRFGASIVVSAIAVSCHLTKLKLLYSAPTQNLVDALVILLSNSPRLTHLDLYFERRGCSLAPVFERLSDFCPQLLSLCLRHTFSQTDAQAFCRGAAKCVTLTHLRLAHGKQQAAVTAEFAEVVRQLPALVDVWWNAGDMLHKAEFMPLHELIVSRSGLKAYISGRCEYECPGAQSGCFAHDEYPTEGNIITRERGWEQDHWISYRDSDMGRHFGK